MQLESGGRRRRQQGRGSCRRLPPQAVLRRGPCAWLQGAQASKGQGHACTQTRPAVWMYGGRFGGWLFDTVSQQVPVDSLCASNPRLMIHRIVVLLMINSNVASLHAVYDAVESLRDQLATAM